MNLLVIDDLAIAALRAQKELVVVVPVVEGVVVIDVVEFYWPIGNIKFLLPKQSDAFLHIFVLYDSAL